MKSKLSYLLLFLLISSIFGCKEENVEPVDYSSNFVGSYGSTKYNGSSVIDVLTIVRTNLNEIKITFSASPSFIVVATTTDDKSFIINNSTWVNETNRVTGGEGTISTTKLNFNIRYRSNVTGDNYSDSFEATKK